MKYFLCIVIFLCNLAVPILATDYYVAQERDLPDWARQGKFHFLRVDGGEIEKTEYYLYPD